MDSYGFESGVLTIYIPELTSSVNGILTLNITGEFGETEYVETTMIIDRSESSISSEYEVLNDLLSSVSYNNNMFSIILNDLSQIQITDLSFTLHDYYLKNQTLTNDISTIAVNEEVVKNNIEIMDNHHKPDYDSSTKLVSPSNVHQLMPIIGSGLTLTHPSFPPVKKGLFNGANNWGHPLWNGEKVICVASRGDNSLKYAVLFSDDGISDYTIKYETNILYGGGNYDRIRGKVCDGKGIIILNGINGTQHSISTDNGENFIRTNPFNCGTCGGKYIKEKDLDHVLEEHRIRYGIVILQIRKKRWFGKRRY